jgi:hypothetical protein
MNSDLTPVQSAGTTGNPQSVNGSPTASDSSAFQQSAGVDALTQKNKSLSVERTGKPISGSAVSAGSAVLMWVFIIVASIVLIMIASSVFKWIMKRPEPVKEKSEKPKAKAEFNAPPITVIRPKSKKKQPRSKRKK